MVFNNYDKVQKKRKLRNYQLDDSHVFRLCENKTMVGISLAKERKLSVPINVCTNAD